MEKKTKALTGILLGLVWALLPFSGPVSAAGEPVISRFFASPELVSGETWKIYIQAESPAADMTYIYATVEQKGGTNYPVSLIRVKKGEERVLSGYVYLNTSSAASPLNLYPLDLTLQVKDERGRFSNPVVFPLAFKWRASKQEPPPGVFAEKDLGPIMIQLHPVHDFGDNSYSPD